ncbi:MAG: SHOCT domain-containing protein [Chloroflexota bacterium]
MEKEDYIEKISVQTGFSHDAVSHMWDSMLHGNMAMAQFNHPEFGGMGQWQSGGMLMIGDMFNNQLKGRVAGLCQIISDTIQQNRIEFGRVQAQSSGSWWPEEYGQPAASGGQNDMRYAWFRGARRLVIELQGVQTIFDTAEHVIGGVSQQNGSLTFTSQFGTIHLDSLNKI